MNLVLLLTGSIPLLIACAAMLLLTRINAAAQSTVRTQTLLAQYRRRGTVWAASKESPLQRLPLLDLRLAAARLLGIDVNRRADYPVQWWIVLVAAMAAARVASWTIGLLVPVPVWPPVPVLWFVFCRVVFAFFAKRRRDRLFRQFPDALGMVVRALRAGHTVSQALRGVARDAQQPTAMAFARLADRLAIGVPLAEAMPEMAEDTGLTEYHFFATTLLLQNQTGGSLTEALDNLAEMVRNRVALRRRAYAMAGEARASAIVLGVMPVGAFLALLLVVPDYARLLLDDPLGRQVLGVAIGMLIVGAIIMNTMIQKLLG